MLYLFPPQESHLEDRVYMTLLSYIYLAPQNMGVALPIYFSTCLISICPVAGGGSTRLGGVEVLESGVIKVGPIYRDLPRMPPVR